MKLHEIFENEVNKTEIGAHYDLYVHGYNVAMRMAQKLAKNEHNELKHHKAITVGLWATDRPDLINDPKKIMFEITD